MSAWADGLDSFERRLRRCRRLLDEIVEEPGADPEPLPTFELERWPTPELIAAGPMPAELRPRAEALLAAGRALEQDLMARRAALPPLPSRAFGSGRRRSATSPSRFDRSA